MTPGSNNTSLGICSIASSQDRVDAADPLAVDPWAEAVEVQKARPSHPRILSIQRIRRDSPHPLLNCQRGMRFA
jgi:hypothetical protein